MRPAAFALVTVGCLVGTPPAASAQAREDLAAALADAVDRPEPSERRAAARDLAKRSDASLEEWLAAMRAFRQLDARAPESVELVDLFVDGKFERSELALYVPASHDPSRPAPLMLTHHGTGGSGQNVVRMWRSIADDLGMIVLAPSEAGANEGYASSQRERDSALAALRWARRRFDVDENKIFVSGFSRGGHLTWDLALRHPDRFAAMVPMVGGPRFELRRGSANLRYLENVKHLAIRDLQGARDDPRLVFNVRLAFQKLEAMGAPDAVLHEFPELGHNVDLGAVDWHAFLGGAARDPLPGEVVRAYAREGEGRAFWVEVLEGSKNVEEVFRPKLSAQRHARMSDEDLRRFLVEEAEKRTGRLAVRSLGPGRFEADAKRIKRFRLLLTGEMIGPDDTVEVRVGGKLKKRKARPSKRLLLEEFVERFDRRFLPLAEVEIRT